MKRLIIVVLTAVMILSCVGAETVEELYQRVTETSPKFSEIRLSRRSEFVESVLAALKGPTWSISLQSATLTASKDFMYPVDITLPGLDVSYSTPENQDQVSFETRLSIGSLKFAWDSSASGKRDHYVLGDTQISLKESLSKKYEFKSWDATDYSKVLSERQRNISYETSLIEFENDFLKSILTVLEWQKETEKKSTALAILSTQYEQDVESGKLNPESPEGTKRKAEVDIAQTEFDQQLESINESLNEFKKTYGVELTTISGADRYELEFTPDPDENTDVYSKYVDYLTAVQRVDEKTGKSSTLSLSASLEPKAYFANDIVYDKAGVGASLSASYSSGNLSVDASLSTEYTIKKGNKGSFESGPELSVSLSWSNTPTNLSNAELEKLKEQYTKNGKFDVDAYERTLRDLRNSTLKKEALELEQLENAMNKAEVEWEAAINEYIQKANELVAEIKEFKNSLEIQKIKHESDLKAYKQYEELANQGKATSADLLNAALAVAIDNIDAVISNVRSHVLYNRILLIRK